MKVLENTYDATVDYGVAILAVAAAVVGYWNWPASVILLLVLLVIK